MNLTEQEFTALDEVWNAHQTGKLSDFKAPLRMLLDLHERGFLHGWSDKDNRKFLMLTEQGKKAIRQ